MAEVVSIRGDVSQSENKQAFLDMVAREFDHFVLHDGSEPCFLALSFVGKDGAALAAWLGRNEAEEGVSLYIARALAKLTRDVLEMDN